MTLSVDDTDTERAALNSAALLLFGVPERPKNDNAGARTRTIIR